jgi:hypothetical protein
MSKNTKPTLEVGQYDPEVEVVYVDEKRPRFSGTYRVALGAEIGHPGYKHRERLVLVEGHAMTIYAMVRQKDIGKYGEDRTILRDKVELQKRAIEVYIFRVLEKDEELKDIEAARLRRLADMDAGIYSREGGSLFSFMYGDRGFLKNRVAVKFEFDATVPDEERELIITAVQKSLAGNRSTLLQQT